MIDSKEQPQKSEITLRYCYCFPNAAANAPPSFRTAANATPPISGKFDPYSFSLVVVSSVATVVVSIVVVSIVVLSIVLLLIVVLSIAVLSIVISSVAMFAVVEGVVCVVDAGRTLVDLVLFTLEVDDNISIILVVGLCSGVIVVFQLRVLQSVAVN